ncbi:nuclear transport factor 2 family protein [Flavobacterium crassostreae]|uniref:SnoaL-like domain-containing protein n=1 Tax=Flavobacterium crassostreae TaxID=1763534 RepID=A0A1B9DZU6_9FLAO|nr:nuclear transport factor 2 family protein [Flavobacterium crassostreae]OCB75225.1 hypothetical protein LPBF_09210 [Flavobacterium crassostreae]
MSSEKLQSIAFKWIEAFNNKDLDKLLCLYDEQAVHFSPKLKIKNPATNGLITGKDALREWWQTAFDTIAGLQYKLSTLTTNEDRVFMEYTRITDQDAPLLVAEVLDIRDNKIVASRVYHG